MGKWRPGQSPTSEHLGGQQLMTMLLSHTGQKQQLMNLLWSGASQGQQAAAPLSLTGQEQHRCSNSRNCPHVPY
ncbi:hypothetical protein Hamer_G020674 [Homarus americanus]|uniref:Uncharacterized protein n=1 Tax=Homarus americanus TaxID=6706 RepID=A0A8J5JI91_HOMAM|nr:hypothetical protein Hamer_G020674 [Homarus americanus]